MKLLAHDRTVPGFLQRETGERTNDVEFAFRKRQRLRDELKAKS
jgi:hypothetical protein